MSDIYSVICSCGFDDAKAKYREKDSPFSSHGIWTFTGLICIKNTVEEPGDMSLSNALKEAEPKCPKCNVKITKDHVVAV